MQRQEASSQLMPRALASLTARLRPPLARLRSIVDQDGAPRHLPQGMRAEDLLGGLENEGLPHVVLDLGTGTANGPDDLTLLVADEAVPFIDALLLPWSTGAAITVYSVTGLPGFAFSPPDKSGGQMALLPPYLARRVLDGSHLDEAGFRVPEKRDAFFARAYAAVYLGGHASGLGSLARPFADDNPAALRFAKDAHELGLDLAAPVTLESLDAILADNDWRPPRDLLERVADWNPWVHEHFFERDAAAAAYEPGVALFFVRQTAFENGHESAITMILEDSGFEILRSIPLDGPLAERIANTVRGGNWGRGPWPVSGGPPTKIIVAFDVIPQPVSAADKRRHPGLDNGRILTAKEGVRIYLNDKLDHALRYNALHSTDSSRHSVELLESLPDVDVEALLALVAERRQEFSTGYTVVRTLTRHGKRAKVELVEFQGKVAVKKTYRHQALRFLEREVAFQEQFAALRPEVLPVLESGSNYFITPYVEDIGAPLRVLGVTLPRLLGLKHVRQLAEFIQFLLAHGYDPIDLTPWNNVLIDRQTGLKAIDFEFVYRNPDGTIVPEKSMCLTGLKEEFDGDYPHGVFYLKNPYATEWYPRIGLDLPRFLRGATWRHQPLRYLNFLRYVVRWTIKGALRSDSNSLSAVVGRLRRRLSGRKSGMARSLDPGAKSVAAGSH
jgi:hypothetical protein